MIKAVAFDMDGVLVNTEGFYNERRAAYLSEVLPDYDGPWDFSGSNDVAIWQTIVPEDAALREELHAGYEDYRESHPEPYERLVNPHALSVLCDLKDRGMVVAIASSSDPEMVERMMRATGMWGLVDYHVSGCEVAAHKPAPDIYRNVMDHVCLAPEELAVVEDSPTGIAAGVASGAHVIALSQFVQEGCDQSAAHEHIGELCELGDVL